jgi:hypothetical protein
LLHITSVSSHSLFTANILLFPRHFHALKDASAAAAFAFLLNMMVEISLKLLGYTLLVRAFPF